jgi:hypothetical protein
MEVIVMMMEKVEVILQKQSGKEQHMGASSGSEKPLRNKINIYGSTPFQQLRCESGGN